MSGLNVIGQQVEKNIRSNDGDYERCPLQLAGNMVSRTNRRVVGGAAGILATTSQNCNGDHASTEADVKDDCDQSEEGNAAEEAREENGENCVEHSCPRYPLDGLLPLRNGRVRIISSEMGEKV